MRWLLAISFDDFAQLFHRCRKIAAAEKSRAADKSIGPSLSAFCRRCEIDSAIHANIVAEIPGLSPGLRLLNFGQHFVDKCLAAKPRIDGHNQQGIDLVQIRLHQRNRGRRIDGQADPFPQRSYFPEQLSHLITEFDVDVHLIGAGPREGLEQDLGFRSHQMDIEEQLRERPDRAHY